MLNARQQACDLHLSQSKSRQGSQVMSHDMSKNIESDIKKLSQLIQGIKVAMLTTIDENGKIHSRPMMTQQIEPDGQLWFFTDVSTHKVQEVDKNHQVQINYASGEKNRFVSITGNCQLVRDREKAKAMWRPIYKAWFPNGLEDPNLALLRVQIEQAEYWDSPSSYFVQMIGFAKAILTRKPYEGEGSEHKKVDLAS